MSGADHAVPGLRAAHYQRITLHPVQPRLPTSGTQPGLRPAGLEEAQQAGHRRPRRSPRLVVSGLRRASASIERPDSRPHRSVGAGWRAARSDERPLQGLQYPQTLGADADTAGTALRVVRPTPEAGSDGRGRSPSDRTDSLPPRYPRRVINADPSVPCASGRKRYVGGRSRRAPSTWGEDQFGIGLR